MDLKKKEYPNCAPSPLRITTHTIKSGINAADNPDKSFKIDLVKFAQHLGIDDEIRYIEYKNEDIIHVKGINPKSQSKKPSKKGKFYNSLTIITQPESGFFNNIKLFRNGSISGTGIKKIENGEISVNIILDRIKNFSAEIVSIDNNPGLMNEDCAINNYSIALINSDYEVSFDIKRIVLHSLLVNKYKIFSSYEPCIYPGVNTKYFWNTDYVDKQFPGKCYCTLPCKGNGTGTGNGQCKKVTIAIFQSGSLIITGARSLEQIETAYHFINTIFEKHHSELRQGKADFIQPSEDKTEAKTKNAIYIKFSNIVNSPFN